MIRRGDEGGALSETSPLTMSFYQPELVSMAHSVNLVKGLRAGFAGGVACLHRPPARSEALFCLPSPHVSPLFAEWPFACFWLFDGHAGGRVAAQPSASVTAFR